MPLNNDDFSKFVEWVREHRLPMHVTIPDLDKLLGPSTDTFLTTLWALNRKLQKKTGLWMDNRYCFAKSGFLPLVFRSGARISGKSAFLWEQRPRKAPAVEA